MFSYGRSQQRENLFLIHGRNQPVVAFDESSHLCGPMGEAGVFCTIDCPVIDYYHCGAKFLDVGDLDLLPILRSGHVVNVEERLEGPTSGDEIHTR